MNWRATTFLVLAVVPMAAHASEYARVLNKAQLMESALRPKQTIALAQATTGQMKQAMEICDERVSPMHGGLGVVFKINEEGQVTETWTRSGTDYEQCFAAVMADLIEFDPPMDPFFTSIDFGRSE